MDTSLRGFLTSFIDVLLKALIIITVMDIIGIKATSFIAIIGAAGLAVGEEGKGAQVLEENFHFREFLLEVFGDIHRKAGSGADGCGPDSIPGKFP